MQTSLKIGQAEGFILIPKKDKVDSIMRSRDFEVRKEMDRESNARC